MRLLVAWLLLISVIAALSTADAQLDSVSTSDVPTSAPIRSCQKGQMYCFGQIMTEFGIKYQDILHQYCRDQFTVDAQSCHACTKQPFPLPNCWAGPGAWKSMFECVDDQNYKFKSRCDDLCEQRQCVKKPAGMAMLKV